MLARNPGYNAKMGHRFVSGLQEAWLCEKPAGIPQARPRGTKKLGQTYERNFGKALQSYWPFSARIFLGQWFRFLDTNGFGYCQTDVIAEFPLEVVIFECKLTDTEKGRSQINQLYRPVVEKYFKFPARGIIVTRHLTKETDLALICDQLKMAMEFNREAIPTLHWRERAPL